MKIITQNRLAIVNIEQFDSIHIVENRIQAVRDGSRKFYLGTYVDRKRARQVFDGMIESIKRSGKNAYEGYDGLIYEMPGE